MKEEQVMVNLHSLRAVGLEGESPFSLEYSLSFPIELGFVFPSAVWQLSFFARNKDFSFKRTRIKSVNVPECDTLRKNIFEGIFVGLTFTIEVFKTV